MNPFDGRVADTWNPRIARGIWTSTAAADGTFTITHNLGVSPICHATIAGIPGSGAGSRIVHLASATTTQATFQITLSTTGAADANSAQDVHWTCTAP